MIPIMGRRPTPWIICSLFLAFIGGVTVNAAPRMALDDRETTGESIAPERNAMAVVTVRPVFAEWQNLIETSGIIAPWQEAVINAQIGGYQIVELRADVGDVVREGQALAILNQAFLQAQRAELQAKLDQAVTNRKRASALSAKGHLSEKSLLQMETEEKSAKALLDQKLLEIKYATVVAPDAGIVVSRSAMLGQVGQLGTELFRIIRQGRLEWRAEIAASDVVKVSPGQKVEVDLPDGEVAIGTIRKISPILDEATHRGLIYADLVVGSMARAGMFSKGRIDLGLRRALVVPAASLLIKDGRHYVAKVSEFGDRAAVSLVPVTVGRYAGDQAEITDGLSPNDVIVSQGAGLLDDGDRVQVVQTAWRE
nr:efflux RND transporter periplasmic adaptor subunit [uncultured Dongia sp.]